VPEGIKHNKWSNKMNRETLRERILKKDYKDINNWDISDITDMTDAEKHLNMKIFGEGLAVEFIK
jgi:hypothetical protein